MTRTILDIHILQSVPPSNLNRDDTGSPKTAVYGGVRRARVSSQAWKRATRAAFDGLLDTTSLGVRTKRVVELLAAAIAQQSSEPAEASEQLAKSALEAAGIKLEKPSRQNVTAEESKYLLFVSRAQITNLAEAVVEHANRGAALDKALAKRILKNSHSVDVALFGRMVADDTDLNVDAAAQVAHAISVHRVDNEFDYFTAVDDQKSTEEDAGAGMIGTVEFNSSTLYRYATVDVNALQANLGDIVATTAATAAFVEAFVTSMPTGKQNTFANRTLPDAILVCLRTDQPVSLVGAFESAVKDSDGGRLRAAAERLAAYAKDVESAYGRPAEQIWVVGVGDTVASLDALGERVSLPSLVQALRATVSQRITEDA